MFRARPLFATTADSRFMLWTAEAVAVLEALRRGRNVLAYGAAGSGKTTVLHQVEHELRGDGRQVAFVALRGVEDVTEVAPLVLEAATDAGLLEDPETGLPRIARRSGETLAVNRAIRRLEAVPAGTTVLLDDVSPAVGHALFGRLRDELWQIPLSWGVAVEADDAGALLAPPADAFFETRVGLVPLSAEDRVELIKKRAVFGDEGDLSATRIDQLGGSGPGNPRQLIDYARRPAEDGVDPRELVAAAEARWNMAFVAAGRDGTALVGEMENLGPVSASDETLAARLGWPRPRIASTLSRLEDAHLARSYLEAREGRTGRPRKLYELVPPTELLR